MLIYKNKKDQVTTTLNTEQSLLFCIVSFSLFIVGTLNRSKHNI